MKKNWPSKVYLIYNPSMSHELFHERLEREANERKEKQTALRESQHNLLIEGIIEGKTGQQAALSAGFGPALARTPFKIIPPEEMRRRFQEVAERKGLTLDRVADKIMDHLEARQNQTLNGKEVTVSEAPDNRVQQKAIEQLTSLLGMGDAQKAASSGSTVSLNITGPAADRLAAMLGGE